MDKYIGDEVMVVFPEEFGSTNPFADAVQAAAAMSRHDVHAYGPHIGIASGRVIVGYAGTALRYNVSVFGAPVALSARCAAVERADTDKMVSSTVVIPASDWGGRELGDVLPPQLVEQRDGARVPKPLRFELLEERAVLMRGLSEVAVREIHNTGMWLPTHSAENRALDGLHALRANNRYWPCWEVPEPGAAAFSHVKPLEPDLGT